MRIVIAGPRYAEEDPALVAAAVAASPFAGRIETVIEGGARGIDRAARYWAKDVGIRVLTVKADWKRYGKGAGPRRNAAMAAQADGAVVIWDGTVEGSGSLSMIRAAIGAGLPVFVWPVRTTPPGYRASDSHPDLNRGSAGADSPTSPAPCRR